MQIHAVRFPIKKRIGDGAFLGVTFPPRCILDIHTARPGEDHLPELGAVRLAEADA